MNYMTKRNWKKGMNQSKVRGNNMVKYKESILELEKTGSPERQKLKKCLDDAI
jgi:hypothetical protein